MAATRTASAHWEGSLTEGAGQVSLESSGIGTYDVTWPARSMDNATSRISVSSESSVPGLRRDMARRYGIYLPIVKRRAVRPDLSPP